MDPKSSPSAPDSLPNLYQADPSMLASDHTGRLSNSVVGNGYLGSTQSPDNLDSSGKWQSINIERPIYTQPHFDEVIAQNQPDPRYSKSAKERIRRLKSKCECSVQCTKRFLFGILPFIRIMKDYNIRTDLVSDILSGLTVGIMQIPQGMAYGLLASVPAVVGLYTSFWPVLVYFFLGTSKHNSMGTFAVVSLMVGAVVDSSDCESASGTSNGNGNVTTEMMTTGSNDGESDGFTEVELCKISVACAVTLMAGLIQLAMSVFRLGFITIYLSTPLTRGFTTGASMHVFTSQVKHIFGIETSETFSGALKLVYTYIDIIKNVDTITWAAVIISAVCIPILYVTKEYINPIVKKKIKMPFPMELILVIAGTVAVSSTGLDTKYNLNVVGNIPVGIPAPIVPDFNDVIKYASNAIGIAIVAFAIAVSLGQLFAKKHDYEVDSNQELLAMGVSNVIGSFMSSFVSTASLSRSLVQETAGCVTQLCSVVACALVLVVLLWLAPFFETLPNCVLASIIVVALKGMFMQFKDIPKLWKISKIDFLTWMVVFLATVFLDVDLGLLTGVGFSILTVIFRTQRPYVCILGRVPHTDIYKDISVYNAAKEMRGIKIFRCDASLYYANTEYFVNKLYSRTGVNPRKLKLAMNKVQKKRDQETAKRAKELVKMRKNKENNVEAAGDDPTFESQSAVDVLFEMPERTIDNVIIDCTTMGYVDYMGVDTLSQVISEYKEVRIKVYLAGCKAGVREMLEAAKFYEKIDKDILFIRVHDAVLTALERDPDLLQVVRQDSSMVHRDEYSDDDSTSEDHGPVQIISEVESTRI